MNTFYNYLKHSLLATGVVFSTLTTLAFQLTEKPYYEPLENFSYIRPQFVQRAINFETFPTELKISANKFTPSARSFVGIGLHLFDVDVSLNLPVSDIKDSRNLDLRGNIIARKWGITGIWQRYRDFNKVAQSEAVLKHSLVQAYYIFNHRQYSHRAVTNQNEQQTRSAGSPMLYTMITRFQLEDQTGVIKENSSDFGSFEGLELYEHWMFAAMPGYGYTYVKDSWVLNASLAYGVAHYWENYRVTGTLDRDINLHGIYQVGSYLGFDKSTYFAGIHMEYRRFRSGSEQLTNRLSYYSLRLGFGVRFLEKGFFRKSIPAIFSKKKA